MTLLAPLWLWIAAAASAAVVALHFFSRQRPRPAPFPTARFVPDVPARAPSPARKPTDLLLLLLRVLALLAIGLAFARPRIAAERRPITRIVLLGDSTMRDSARAYAGVGDTLIESESQRVGESESLSALLVRAIRASSVLRERADSIELVVVSSFAADAFDAATDSIRSLWPGRARLVRLTALPPSVLRRIEVLGGADDPLRATVALLGARTGPVTRIVRGTVGPADSAFAAAGGVLLEWPSELGPIADTIGAVAAGGVVVVAPFLRGPTLRLSDSPTLRPVALWADGAPAALEHVAGQGCIKQVAIPIPSVGDLALRRSVRELVDVLSLPCGASGSSASASPAQLDRLRGTGPLMAARLAPEPVWSASVISAWLLVTAAVLLLIEMAARPKALRA